MEQSRRQHRKRFRRGFTLLEVMVSLGILAVALMAIGDINGGAVRMHVYARRLTVAVQLARGKMFDIQQLLDKEGLSDYSKEYHGDFTDQGWPEYKWVARVIKPDFDLNTSGLLNKLTSGLGLDQQQGGFAGLLSSTGLLGNPALSGLSGGSSSSSSMSMSSPSASNPSALLGPFQGIIDSQVKTISENIKSSVREVKLTVSWKAGATEDSFDVVQHLVVLPNQQQADDANATAKVTQGASGQAASANNPLGTSSSLNSVLGGAGLTGSTGSSGSIPLIQGAH